MYEHGKSNISSLSCEIQDQGQEHLVDKLTKNAGFGMGLEFRESANVLSADSQVPVRAGMVFNVSMGEHLVSALMQSDGILDDMA